MRYEPHRSCFAIDAVHCVHRILRTGAAAGAVICAINPELCKKAIQDCFDAINGMYNEASDNADEEGCIYCVSGDKTNSGKDYIGSTDNLGNRQRDKSDGRDREGAEIVDTYPKGDRDTRRNKEQQAINDRGGVDNLDNKRNEVAPKKWPDRGITPP